MELTSPAFSRPVSRLNSGVSPKAKHEKVFKTELIISPNMSTVDVSRSIDQVILVNSNTSEDVQEPDSEDGTVPPEEEWDTDLEGDDDGSSDYSGKQIYLEACNELGVVPVSYFLRNMHSESLTLKHHGLGPLGAKAIAIPLVSNTFVLKLDLADNWLEASGACFISDMLKENCYITDLNLADNNVCGKGLGAICDMLGTNIYIKNVNLSGNKLKDGDADVLAETILENSRINELDLSHNEFSELAGEVLGHAIGENEVLEHLNLSWNHLRRGGAQAICEGVKVNARLKTLDLSWNGFGNEGAAAMADAIRHNSILVDLDISNNRISIEGCVQLAKGLDANETLQVFRMGQNPIGEAGAHLILNAIHNDRSVLRVLDLTDILVDKSFETLKKEIQQSRNLTVIYGGLLSNYVLTGKYKKNKDGGFDLDSMSQDKLEDYLRSNPMAILKAWIEKKNLRLVDFFNQFDKDKSMSLTYDEFKYGVKQMGINLTDRQLDVLVNHLDSGPRDGVIDYRELVQGAQTVVMETRKLRKQQQQMFIHVEG